MLAEQGPEARRGRSSSRSTRTRSSSASSSRAAETRPAASRSARTTIRRSSRPGSRPTTAQTAPLSAYYDAQGRAEDRRRHEADRRGDRRRSTQSSRRLGQGLARPRQRWPLAARALTRRGDIQGSSHEGRSRDSRTSRVVSLVDEQPRKGRPPPDARTTERFGARRLRHMETDRGPYRRRQYSDQQARRHRASVHPRHRRRRRPRRSSRRSASRPSAASTS